jgi:hypothetical protein
MRREAEGLGLEPLGRNRYVDDDGKDRTWTAYVYR